MDDREGTHHERLHDKTVTCVSAGRVGTKDILATGTLLPPSPPLSSLPSLLLQAPSLLPYRLLHSFPLFSFLYYTFLFSPFLLPLSQSFRDSINIATTLTTTTTLTITIILTFTITTITTTLTLRFRRWVYTVVGHPAPY